MKGIQLIDHGICIKILQVLWFSNLVSRTVIAISCLAFTVWQSSLLYQNYASKDTLRKLSHKESGEVITPTFVFCKNSPFEDPVNDILTPHYDDHYFPGVNITVHKMITMFKVHKIYKHRIKTNIYREYVLS